MVVVGVGAVAVGACSGTVPGAGPGVLATGGSVAIGVGSGTVPGAGPGVLVAGGSVAIGVDSGTVPGAGPGVLVAGGSVAIGVGSGTVPGAGPGVLAAGGSAAMGSGTVPGIGSCVAVDERAGEEVAVGSVAVGMVQGTVLDVSGAGPAPALGGAASGLTGAGWAGDAAVGSVVPSAGDGIATFPWSSPASPSKSSARVSAGGVSAPAWRLSIGSCSLGTLACLRVTSRAREGRPARAPGMASSISPIVPRSCGRMGSYSPFGHQM